MAAVAMSHPRGIVSSAALRNAETLFETQTVVEIREVETKTRMDVEDKKKQLRLLVGDSYRDLISSADIILDMAKCCDSVVGNIKGLQEGFADLAGSIQEASQTKQQRGAQGEQRQLLYALGSRIKFLVDTPEMIWGALDTRAYLEAAQRYLRASEVHRLLLGAAKAEVQSRFPLVAHLWPNVEKFRSQIMERVSTWLRSEPRPRADDAAVALAAAAFLQGLSSKQALALFLSARRTSLRARLAAARGAPGVTALAAALCEVVAQLQEGVCLAGELLLLRPLGTGHPLLPSVVEDDGLSGGELLFEPLPSREGAAGGEAEAWSLLRTTITDGLPPLGQDVVGAACSAWLAEAAADFGETAKTLLATCTTAAELASVEAALRASISAWEHHPLSAKDDGSILSPPLSAARSSAATVFQSEGPELALPTTWEGICEWVLGRRVALWDEVFEQAFQERAKELISASFQAIATGLEGPLDDCLRLAKTSPAAPAGEYRTAQWPEEGGASAPDPRKRPRVGAVSAAGGSAAAATAAAAESGESGGWRSLIGALQAAWDQQLHEALEGALLLMVEPAPTKEGRRRETLPPRPARRGMGVPSARVTALEPFVQEQCGAAAAAVAASLEARLAALPVPSTADAAVVEQALLIGRLCTSFGGPDTFLRVVLGSPEGWRGTTLGSSGGSGNLAVGRAQATRLPSPRGPAASQFESLQERYRVVAMNAAQLWARWAGTALAARLRQLVEADVALYSPVPLRTWEDTVITQDDELGGEAVEMRFALPAGASPAALALLLGSGAEVQRAGAVSAASTALQLLEWELGGALLSALRAALKIGTPLDCNISEKGVLQLLFDLRFLRDALAGGRPAAALGPPAGSGAARVSTLDGGPAAGERKRSFAALEASLQERLDPIDWATYEPYLWANEALFYQRVGVLFGALLHLHRVHTDVVNKSAASAEANILRLAPTASRFAYLPISTPSVTATGLRRLNSTGPGTPRGFERTTSGVGGEFSFANSIGARVGIPEDQAVTGESAASSAFEALQNKFTSQRLGAFGSLLGDKAAEVTAMAQQSLGDIGLPSSLTSALGSSGGGASGLLSTLRQYTSKDPSK